MRITLYLILLRDFINAYSGFEPFIIGGHFTQIEKYPHAVAVRLYCNNSTTHVITCGSSILNQHILLTAAHCLKLCKKGSKILANVGNKNKKEGELHEVSSFVIHENYGRIPSINVTSNDIALLKLKTRLKLSKTASRVAIMKHPPYKEGASVAGWGNTDGLFTGNKTIYLKELTGLKILSRYECIDLYKQYYPQGTICAGHNFTFKDDRPSFGDSGSALIVRDYIQVGIVSIRLKGAVVFTEVAHFYDWIKINAKKLIC